MLVLFSFFLNSKSGHILHYLTIIYAACIIKKVVCNKKRKVVFNDIRNCIPDLWESAWQGQYGLGHKTLIRHALKDMVYKLNLSKAIQPVVYLTTIEYKNDLSVAIKSNKNRMKGSQKLTMTNIYLRNVDNLSYWKIWNFIPVSGLLKMISNKIKDFFPPNN